jgi:hypothetical protein
MKDVDIPFNPPSQGMALKIMQPFLGEQVVALKTLPWNTAEPSTKRFVMKHKLTVIHWGKSKALKPMQFELG